MFSGICSNRGFAIVEALVALCILTIGLIGLLTVLPMGWTSAASSDFRSRASEILYAELENAQSLLENPCNSVPVGTYTVRTIYASGGTTPSGSGDIQFKVTPTIAQTNTAPNEWLVTMQITWPGNTTGITASRSVIVLNSSSYPAGCANSSLPILPSAI